MDLTEEEEKQLRQTICNFREEGMNYVQVANILNINHQIVKKYYRELASETFGDIKEPEEYKENHIFTLQENAYQALQAFRNSLKKKKTKEKKKYTNSEGEITGEVETEIEEDQAGDAKLLAIFLKTMEDIRKVLQMTTESKPIIINNQVSHQNLSIDERIKLFQSIPLKERIQLISTIEDEM